MSGVWSSSQAGSSWPGASTSTPGGSVFAGSSTGNRTQPGPNINSGIPWAGGTPPPGFMMGASPLGGMALFGLPNGGMPMGTWAGDHSFAFPGSLQLAMPGQQGTSYDGSPAMYAPGQTVGAGEHWVPGEADFTTAPQAPGVGTTSLRTTALRRLAQGQRLAT